MFSLIPFNRSKNYCLKRPLDRSMDDPFIRFFNELDSTIQNWSPAVEVIEKDNGYVFEFEVPGIEQKNLDISLEDGVLKVVGERTFEENDEKRLRSERSYGKFTRSFRLPETADPSSVKANLKDGILRVSVSRREEAKPKKIEVQIM